MQSVTVFLIFGVILRIQSTLGALPSTIQVCPRNHPDLNKCVKDSVEKLRTRLATGVIDENFKILPLEPLALANINMDRGSEFKATFSDLLVNGPSKFQIDNLKINLDKLTFDFNIYLPKLSFRGKYDLKLKLLLLNIAGKGDLKGTVENNKARVKLYLETYEKDGEKYLRAKRLAVKIQIEKGHFEMKDLFSGDPVLSQVGNQFINDNSRLFLDELTPGLERSLAETFKNTANEILKQATADEIFPPA